MKWTAAIQQQCRPNDREPTINKQERWIVGVYYVSEPYLFQEIFLNLGYIT